MGGRGKGEKVDGFSLDMGAFVFTHTYDTAFRLCKELGLPLVPSTMKFGHYRSGRWVTTTPEQSPWNFVRHLRSAIAMGFLSPSGMRSGYKVMREIHRQAEYMSFAGDSPLAEIDDDESFGEYLDRLGVPEKLKVTLGGPLDMILGDPMPAGQALMRAYIGETMLHSGRVHMPERGIGSLSEALANACSDAIRVSTPARRIVVADGKATGVVVDGETIEADAVICAVPGTKAPGLIPELPAETRRALSSVSYSTGCRVVIGLDHSPLRPGWHGALFPEDDDTPLMLDRSAFLPACAPPGKSILDLLIGRDRARELIPLDDEEIKRGFWAPFAGKRPGLRYSRRRRGTVLPRVPLGRGAVHGGTRDARRDGQNPGPASRAHRQPVPGGRLHARAVGQWRPLQRLRRRNGGRRPVGVPRQLGTGSCRARAAPVPSGGPMGQSRNSK